MTKKNRFPAGWNEARVNAVLRHYEEQTEDEAVAEDEAAFRTRGQTVMVVPQRPVPAITRLITREKTMALRKRPNKTYLDSSVKKRHVDSPPSQKSPIPIPRQRRRRSS
jgi:hypothetical protein